MIEILIPYLPVVCIVLPLMVAALIGLGLSPRWPVVFCAALVTGSAALMYSGAQTVISLEWAGILPGTTMSLRVDMLSWLMATMAGLMWLLATVYSLGYFLKGMQSKRIYAALMITLGGVQGVFLAGDLLTLLVCFEVMSLCGYFLIIHEETAVAFRAGSKYLYMSIGGGLALFTAVLLTYLSTGTLILGEVALGNGGGRLALYCYFASFGLKAGLVPLHTWLPDAHPVAPSPASALLSGLMLKTGTYGLFRVVFELYGPERVAQLGGQTLLLTMAVASMVLGSVAAFVQQDLKRRLAYSSIAHLGYIALGIGLLTRAGLSAAVYHIMAHAFMKSLLFLAAGVMSWAKGYHRVDQWRGAGKVVPLVAGALAIGAFSMVGIPPLAGFVGKWELGLAAVNGGWPWLMALLVISGLANAAYYLPLVNLSFFIEDDYAPFGSRYYPIPLSMVAPVVLLAAACLAPLYAGNWMLSIAQQIGHILSP